MTDNLPARLDRSAEVTELIKSRMPAVRAEHPLPSRDVRPADFSQAGPSDPIMRQLNWLVWIMGSAGFVVICLLGFIAILALQNNDNSQLLATNQDLAETVKDLVDELRAERAEEKEEETKLNGLMIVAIMLGLAGALIAYGLAGSFGLGIYAIGAMIAGLYYIGAI